MNSLRAYVVGPLALGLLLVGLASLRLDAGAKNKDRAISAVDFMKVYTEQSAEFDKTYKGKTVTIEGLVGVTGVKLTSEAGKAAGKTYLMIDGYKKPGRPISYQVRCEENGPDFEGIRAGHKVRIRGVVQPYSDRSVAAELRDCKVVKVFAADYPPSKAARAEVKKLQGRWKVTGAEANGKKLPANQAGFDAIVVTGYNVYLEQGKTSLSFGVAIDPEKTPRTLDLVGRVVLPCIYTLEKDTLKLELPAANKDGTFRRAQSFDTAESKGHLLIAERQK